MDRPVKIFSMLLWINESDMWIQWLWKVFFVYVSVNKGLRFLLIPGNIYLERTTQFEKKNSQH